MICLKTIEIPGKITIKKLIFVKKTSSLAIISKKISLYKLVKKSLTCSNYKTNPIIEIYFKDDQKSLIIFRKYDLVIMEPHNGRKKFIRKYNLILEKSCKEIEACSVQVINEGQNFFIGTVDGDVYFVNFNLKLKKCFSKHQRSIVEIFYVNKGNICLSIAKESFYFQKI